MLIENAFTVPVAADRLWSSLLDVERVAPCFPSAELTETLDERTWKGRVTVKLGPVSLEFAGTVEMQERDDAAHRMVLRAKGLEEMGKGAASALVTSWLEPGEGLTTVRTQAEIKLTGSVAQLSRGLLPDVTRKLTNQFAECLRASMLAAEGTPAGDVPAGDVPVEAAPVGGLRLALWAIWRWITRPFRRSPTS